MDEDHYTAECEQCGYQPEDDEMTDEVAQEDYFVCPQCGHHSPY